MLEANQAKDYAAAQRAAENAYRLRPDPNLLFNLGKFHHKQGHKAEAIDYYERFLANKDSSVTPELRRAIQGYLIDLRQPVVNAIVAADAVAALENAARLKGLTSFSAVTIPAKSFTIDVGAGFPHFLNVRFNFGIVRFRDFGLDSGGEVRTNLYQTDVGANFRAQLLRLGPIAIGASIWLGGGGGPRKRNSFSFELGLPMTLVAGNLVKLTLRPYLQYYTDRLCPGEGELTQLRDNSEFATLLNLIQPEHIGDRCASSDDKTVAPTALARYGRNAIADAAGIDPNTRMAVTPSYDINKTTLGADKITVYTYQEAGTPVLDRFSGVRWMLQAVVEISLTTNGSIWAIIEGAPGQGARQQYTDKFNRVFPITDFPLYGRIGYTAKF